MSDHILSDDSFDRMLVTSAFSLAGIRKAIWELTDAFLTSDHPAAVDPANRANMLSFRSSLEKSAEAMYIFWRAHIGEPIDIAS